LYRPTIPLSDVLLKSRPLQPGATSFLVLGMGLQVLSTEARITVDMAGFSSFKLACFPHTGFLRIRSI
jgi:hypothetical protein